MYGMNIDQQHFRGLLLNTSACGCLTYCQVAPHAGCMWGDSKVGEVPVTACVKQRDSFSIPKYNKYSFLMHGTNIDKQYIKYNVCMNVIKI